MRANKSYEYTTRIKYLLVTGWIVLFGASLFYTNYIIKALKEENRRNLLFQLKTYEKAINSDVDSDAGFIFTEIIQDAKFPIILTDVQNNITSWRNIPGIPDTVKITPEIYEELKKMMAEMDEEYSPIEIRYGNITLSRFHYGEKPLISQLRWLSLIQAFIITAFIIIGYLGFSMVRNHEQNLMWIGLAKETAHQMGTPISSLMGWTALLREEKGIPEKPLVEIEKDIKRLQIVANRFSKIGSEPSLRKLNLSALLKEIENYFQKRLPQMGKNIRISVTASPDLNIKGNRDLLTWVFENMVRNAMDAMDKKEGLIEINAYEDKGNAVILVKDNGSGISGKTQKNIFRPGYSTKKRGWGLGLTLVKRIVEEYHRGKIFILETEPGVGTVFQIVLPWCCEREEKA